jgi:hypothetical protein
MNGAQMSNIEKKLLEFLKQTEATTEKRASDKRAI